MDLGAAPGLRSKRSSYRWSVVEHTFEEFVSLATRGGKMFQCTRHKSQLEKIWEIP